MKRNVEKKLKKLIKSVNKKVSKRKIKSKTIVRELLSEKQLQKLNKKVNKHFGIKIIFPKYDNFLFDEFCSVVRVNIKLEKKTTKVESKTMSLLDSDLKSIETITQENNLGEILVEVDNFREKNEPLKLLDLSSGLMDYIREKNNKTKISYKIVVTEEGVEIFERNLGVYPAGDKVGEKELQEDFENIIINER